MRAVKNRFLAIKVLLQDQYPYVKELTAVEDMINDVVMLDRKLRKLTEGEEKDLKKILAQEWQIENGFIN